MLASRDRKHQKVVHDGPPYANGPMHFGHAMNRTLKDILTRRWFLEGYWSHFIPG
jgi:isoleucyl-tRNA synthetase